MTITHRGELSARDLGIFIAVSVICWGLALVIFRRSDLVV